MEKDFQWIRQTVVDLARFSRSQGYRKVADALYDALTYIDVTHDNPNETAANDGSDKVLIGQRHGAQG